MTLDQTWHEKGDSGSGEKVDHSIDLISVLVKHLAHIHKLNMQLWKSWRRDIFSFTSRMMIFTTSRGVTIVLQDHGKGEVSSDSLSNPPFNQEKKEKKLKDLKAIHLLIKKRKRTTKNIKEESTS